MTPTRGRLDSSLEGWSDWAAGLLAVALACFGVGWAWGPGQYLWLDEIGNLTRFPHGVRWQDITLLPHALYNDRPVGLVVERWLYSIYGFDYAPQLAWFLGIHAINLVLAWLLFRRVGISRKLSFTAIAIFGVLSTTAQTATYLGAVFDVLSLGFFLAAALALLCDGLLWTLSSVLLFYLALRTKEIAIVFPGVFLLLALGRWPTAKTIRRCARLWPHAIVWAIFAFQYLRLYWASRAEFTGANPYTPDLHAATLAHSYDYYTRLLLGLEDRALDYWPWLCVAVAAALIAIALIRRNLVILAGLVGFVVTLLPVAMLPAQRAPFYLYVPQLLLLMALAAAAEEAISMLPQTAGRGCRILISAGLLAWAASFRESSYFIDRTHFMQEVRQVSARSGEEALRLPRRSGPTVIDVSSESQTPWLFLAGPCFFFRVAWENPDVTCRIHASTEESGPPGEGVVRLHYKADGSIVQTE